VNQVPLLVRSKYDFAAFAAYRRLFLERKFDLAVTHFSPDYLMPAMAARGIGPKMVMTRHVGVPWRQNRTRTYRKLYHRFLAVSKFVANIMVEQGIPAEFLQVPHAGVPDLVFDASREETRSKYGMGGTSVGVIGRLVSDKGQHVAIEAIKGLAEAELHLFGSGPTRATLEGKAEGLPVKLHGHVTEVSDILRALDIVLIPSVWDDAFPLSVLEAMASGSPIIASRVGGVPEALVDGQNAVLVPRDDAAHLRAAIGTLSRDKALADKLGQQARADYLANFSLEAMAERLEAAYRAIVTT